jgi:peptide/nickel transport system permease protein
VLVAVSLLAFGLVYVSGDPVRALVPIDASPEDMDNVRRGFGLDRPLPVQYLRFVERALRGDLGESFKYRTNSLELVVQRLPNTILLAVASIALAVTVAIPLGVVAGSRRRSLVDTLATGLAILLISTPSFWLGILLILLGADWLGILPASGAGSVRHLVMPAMALAAASMGLVTRLVRATMADALRQRYVTTAHAKGLSPVRVHYLHALRNCLIPTVTVVGLQFGALLGGAVVVETVFAWPGVGWLLIQAINARDLPLIRSAVLVVATFVVLINLAIDLLYGVLDPRIRYT